MNLKRKLLEGHISRVLKAAVFMVSLCGGSSLLASIDYKVGNTDSNVVDQERSMVPDEALEKPCEELLKFCKGEHDGSFLYGNSSDFDLDGFTSLLFDCIAANSQDKVEINGEVLSVVDAMSLDSADAIYRLGKSIEAVLEGNKVKDVSSKASAYLLMMNNFWASLSSRLYAVRNRIRPEDKNVSLIINYLVYSGCLEEIGADNTIDWITQNLKNGAGLHDFTVSLARLVFISIGFYNERQLKEQIKNCFNNCKSSFKNWTKERTDKLIRDSKYKDRIVFVKDWWNVSVEELRKIRAFLSTVLGDYIAEDKTIGEIPAGLRECLRPYIMLFISHSSPFDEYDDARLNKRLADILDPRPTPYALARRKKVEEDLSIAGLNGLDLTSPEGPDLEESVKEVLSNVCTTDQLSGMDSDSVWRKCIDLGASLCTCLERYAARIKESYIANNGDKEHIAAEIEYLTTFFSVRHIRPICLLSEFIDRYLCDNASGTVIDKGVAAAAYSFMWNVFHASELADVVYRKISSENRCVIQLVNYLVHAVGLENIGADKILEKLIGNLRRGEVGIKDFAISIYGLICDSLNECDSDEAKFKKLDEQIRNCFNNCLGLTDEYPNIKFNRSVLKHKNALVYLKSRHNIPSREIGNICNFISLVLKYYGDLGSGYNSMKLENLPGNVKEVIRPYIMLPLKGESYVPYTPEVLNATSHETTDDLPLNERSSIPYTPEILDATFPEIVAKLNTAMVDARAREAEDAAAQRIIETNNALGARQAIRRAPTTHQDIRSIRRSSNIDSIASVHSRIDSVPS